MEEYPKLMVGDGFRISCVEPRGEDWVYSDDIAEVTIAWGYEGLVPSLGVYAVRRVSNRRPTTAWFLKFFDNIRSKIPDARVSWQSITPGFQALRQLAAEGKLTLTPEKGSEAWHRVALVPEGQSRPT